MLAEVCSATYRVACQIIRTPAFPPAEVLQVVEVVDASRKRHLSSHCIKLLQTQTRRTGGVVTRAADRYEHTH